MKLEKINIRTKEYEGQRIVRTDYVVGGYAVAVFDYSYDDGTSHRSVECSAIVNNRYLPEIYFCSGETSRFEIQTTSYGALNVDEFKKFFEAQQLAFDVVEMLNREFFNMEV